MVKRLWCTLCDDFSFTLHMCCLALLRQILRVESYEMQITMITTLGRRDCIRLSKWKIHFLFSMKIFQFSLADVRHKKSFLLTVPTRPLIFTCGVSWPVSLNGMIIRNACRQVLQFVKVTLHIINCNKRNLIFNCFSLTSQSPCLSV